MKKIHSTVVLFESEQPIFRDFRVFHLQLSGRIEFEG